MFVGNSLYLLRLPCTGGVAQNRLYIPFLQNNCTCWDYHVRKVLHRTDCTSLLSQVHFKNQSDIYPARASCTVHIQIIPDKTGQCTKWSSLPLLGKFTYATCPLLRTTIPWTGAEVWHRTAYLCTGCTHPSYRTAYLGTGCTHPSYRTAYLGTGCTHPSNRTTTVPAKVTMDRSRGDVANNCISVHSCTHPSYRKTVPAKVTVYGRCGTWNFFQNNCIC